MTQPLKSIALLGVCALLLSTGGFAQAQSSSRSGRLNTRQTPRVTQQVNPGRGAPINAQGPQQAPPPGATSGSNVLQLPPEYTSLSREDLSRALAQIAIRRAPTVLDRTVNPMGQWFEISILPNSTVNVLYCIFRKPVVGDVVLSSGRAVPVQEEVRLAAYSRDGNWLNEILVGYSGSSDTQILFAPEFHEVARLVRRGISESGGYIQSVRETGDYLGIFGRLPMTSENARFVYRGEVYIRSGSVWLHPDGTAVAQDMRSLLDRSYRQYIRNLEQGTLVVNTTPNR